MPGQERVPLKLRALRAGFRMAGRVAPVLAGRYATRMFESSRSAGKWPTDMAPLGARRVEIPGHPVVRHGYLWGKSGPLVVLVHGWGADSTSMFGLVRTLQQKGLRVLAFDAPAHGAWPGTRTSMTEYVQATQCAIAALGDTHGVLGHSLGGIAAVAALARMGKHGVQRLAILSAPYSLAAVAERWSRSTYRLPQPVVAEMRAALKQRNGVPVEYWDICTLGRDFEMPVLLMHDEDDDTVPYADAERICGALRHAELEKTTGLGHLRILFEGRIHRRLAQFFGEPLGALAT